MSKVYQVSIEVSGQGYVEVEADSAEDARVRVRRSESARPSRPLWMERWRTAGARYFIPPR